MTSKHAGATPELPPELTAQPLPMQFSPLQTLEERKLLLHTCCAPCTIGAVEELRDHAFTGTITGFFYNPNIHPYREFIARRDALRTWALETDLAMVFPQPYSAVDYFSRVTGNEGERCRHCYDLRLEATARYAAENGFDCFTTTLLISPYQDQDQINRAGQAAAERYQVVYLGYDFRARFRWAQEEARRLGIYRQPYCGCIYSETERFRKKHEGISELS